MKISGIYKIQSIIKPERIYIGSSIDIHSRWWNHIKTLEDNKHRNGRLQNHYNKYGKEDLVFSIILGCDKENLISTEQFFIDTLDPFFNICKVANSNLGRKCSEETKLKMSIAQKGLKKKRKSTKKFNHSEEAKLKMKEKWKIRRTIPMREETRKKHSLSMMGNSYSKGKGIRDSKGRFISKKSKLE